MIFFRHLRASDQSYIIYIIIIIKYFSILYFERNYFKYPDNSEEIKLSLKKSTKKFIKLQTTFYFSILTFVFMLLWIQLNNKMFIHYNVLFLQWINLWAYRQVIFFINIMTLGLYYDPLYWISCFIFNFVNHIVLYLAIII